MDASWVRVGVRVTGNLTIVLAAAWLYAAWKGVPEPHRGTISPKRAALSLFIPFYDAYWGIAVNIALCDTLDGILRRAGSPRRAPRVLGMVANAVWLVTRVTGAAIHARHMEYAAHRVLLDLVFETVVGGLWVAYMVQCDRAREAVVQLGDRVSTLGAPRLSPLQRTPGPSVPRVIVLSLLVLIPGLACWQLVDPGSRRPVAPPCNVQR